MEDPKCTRLVKLALGLLIQLRIDALRRGRAVADVPVVVVSIEAMVD